MENSRGIYAVGEGLEMGPGLWSFGGQTPDFFDQHITNSIPNYSAIHQLVLQVSDFFIPRHGRYYDLGTSTGHLLAKLIERHPQHRQGVQWTGVDSEPNMVEAAKKNLRQLKSRAQWQVLCRDITQLNFQPALMISCLFTLQFIDLDKRKMLLKKIYNSLQGGGGLVIFEKVLGADGLAQDLYQQLYNDFKRGQGHSPGEIYGKGLSLRGKMWPLTSKANRQMFSDAGFTQVIPLYRYLNFEGWLLIK